MKSPLWCVITGCVLGSSRFEYFIAGDMYPAYPLKEIILDGFFNINEFTLGF